MRILFLASARDDLDWMRRYYMDVFPDGADRARRHFRTAETTLREAPLAGKAIPELEARELIIARTPFSFIYRLKEDRIEVLRVWDARADRSRLRPAP